MPWVQIIMAVVQMAMSMKQASDQKKAVQKQAQQQMDEQAKEQWTAYERSEKERKDNLKRALAAKRARMGAAGFSAADGSAGAIIQGLRTDAAEQTHESFTDIKDGLDKSVAGIQSSLLEQSDAAKRKNYSQLGSFAGSIGGSMLAGQQGSEMGSSAGSFLGNAFSS